MRALCLSFGILIALVSGASANWEYAHWGMTPEQVAAASKGMVKALPASARTTIAAANLRSGAEGTHKDGNLLLDVRFSFDATTNGLACVSYVVSNPAQNALLKDILIKRYGPPQSEGGLPAIGLQQLDWTKTDEINLMITTGERATVLHCKP